VQPLPTDSFLSRPIDRSSSRLCNPHWQQPSHLSLPALITWTTFSAAPPAVAGGQLALEGPAELQHLVVRRRLQAPPRQVVCGDAFERSVTVFSPLPYSESASSSSASNRSPLSPSKWRPSRLIIRYLPLSTGPSSSFLPHPPAPLNGARVLSIDRLALFAPCLFPLAPNCPYPSTCFKKGSHVLAIDGHSDGGLRVVRALLDTVATAVLKRPHLHVATTSLEGCVGQRAPI